MARVCTWETCSDPVLVNVRGEQEKKNCSGPSARVLTRWSFFRPAYIAWLAGESRGRASASGHKNKVISNRPLEAGIVESQLETSRENRMHA